MSCDIEANMANNPRFRYTNASSSSSWISEGNGAAEVTSGTKMLPLVIYFLDRPSLLTLIPVSDLEDQKSMLLRIRTAANDTMRSHRLLPWWKCMFRVPVIGLAAVEQVPSHFSSSFGHGLTVESRFFLAAILPPRRRASL